MEETKQSFWGMCASTETDKANSVRVVWWSLAWTTAWVGTTLAIRKEMFSSDYISIGLILLTALLGIGLLFAYRRFLAEADELRRRIELEGMAVGAGVALVGGVTWYLLDQVGMITSAEITDVVVIACLSYCLAVLNGHRRYA